MALVTLVALSFVGFSCGGTDVNDVIKGENERYALNAYYIRTSSLCIFTEGKTGECFLLEKVSFTYDNATKEPVAIVSGATVVLVFRDVSQRIKYNLNAGVAPRDIE